MSIQTHSCSTRWGASAEESGQLDSALAAQAYAASYRLEPTALEPLVNLGNALRQIGQLEEARLAYARAMELAPPIRTYTIIWARSKPYAAMCEELSLPLSKRWPRARSTRPRTRH